MAVSRVRCCFGADLVRMLSMLIRNVGLASALDVSIFEMCLQLTFCASSISLKQFEFMIVTGNRFPEVCDMSPSTGVWTPERVGSYAAGKLKV